MAQKVSICIPTYNQVHYLGGAICSALDQEYENLEVVISDNHSTDGTAEFLAHLGDERLRIVKPDRHLSKGQNFDFCISHSLGQYLTVLCSDDALLPGYVRKVAKVLDDHPTAAFAYTAASIIDEARGTRYTERHVSGSFFRKGNEETRRFLKNAGCVFPSMMLRREFYERSGGFSNSLVEALIDWDIQLRLIALGDVVYHDEVLVEFRIWQTPDRKRRFLRFIEETSRFYDTRVAQVVCMNPDLKRDCEKARRARARAFAYGLSQLESKADFEEGARLVLKMSNSGVIRSILFLHSLGLSAWVANLMVWKGWLRQKVKAIVIWARTRKCSAITSRSLNWQLFC